MTDNEIRAKHQAVFIYDPAPPLRERVIHMLTRDGIINTAELLETADRIVKYIQTGNKDAK